MELRKNLFAAICATSLAGWSASAFAQADFYKGKTITVIAGTTAGMLSIDGLLGR